MNVMKGLQPPTRYSIDGVEVELPDPLQVIAKGCWKPSSTDRPSIGVIVRAMSTIQIPWVSTPFSEYWSSPPLASV